MAKKTFIRQINFEAQSGSRFYVTFEGLQIRGVMYRGQAWFDVKATDVEFATKDFDRSHNLWAYREASLSKMNDVSASAREAIRAALLAEVRAYVANPETKATERLADAERARITGELAECNAEIARLTKSLELAQEKHRALTLAAYAAERPH